MTTPGSHKSPARSDEVVNVGERRLIDHIRRRLPAPPASLIVGIGDDAAVAIVDRGRIVVQGSIEELTRGGAPTVLLMTSDDERARQIAAAHAGVARVERTRHGLDVHLQADNGAVPTITADLNRTLVLAGVDVYRLDPEHATLEQRFLDLTTPLENAA